MARLRPTNLKCVSAVIRYKIVVNIFHYSAARVGGRSREPSRAWSERKGGVEGRSRGVESRPNRGKGRKGFFGRRRERLIRSALFQSFHRGSLEPEERDVATWKGLKRHRGGRRVVVLLPRILPSSASDFARQGCGSRVILPLQLRTFYSLPLPRWTILQCFFD